MQSSHDDQLESPFMTIIQILIFVTTGIILGLDSEK